MTLVVMHICTIISVKRFQIYFKIIKEILKRSRILWQECRDWNHLSINQRLFSNHIFSVLFPTEDFVWYIGGGFILFWDFHRWKKKKNSLEIMKRKEPTEYKSSAEDKYRIPEKVSIEWIWRWCMLQLLTGQSQRKNI